MPELPEVETICRALSEKLVGRSIRDIDILLARLIKWPEPHRFKGMLVGQIIRSVKRRGKYILLEVGEEVTLVIHLRMTGRLYYVLNDCDEKHARIIFHLDNKDRLIYADTRTLGTLHAVLSSEIGRISGLNGMGPEPLTADFSWEYFFQKLEHSKSKIKALLLDQKFIAGLGNIYVDECLALAEIYPARIASSLSPEEMRKLYQAIENVIAAGIEHGGTTFRDYRDGLGKKGEHQNYLYVYGRAGQPCIKCGSIIQKTVIAGRGTSYCPDCQK